MSMMRYAVRLEKARRSGKVVMIRGGPDGWSVVVGRVVSEVEKKFIVNMEQAMRLACEGLEETSDGNRREF